MRRANMRKSLRPVTWHDFEWEARVAAKFIVDRGKGGQQTGPGQGLPFPSQHAGAAGAGV